MNSPNEIGRLESLKVEFRSLLKSDYEYFKCFASKTFARKCMKVRTLGNRLEVEDLLQVGFEQAYKHLHNFLGNSSLKVWICSVIKNVILMQVRADEPRRKVLPSVSVDSVVGENFGFSGSISDGVRNGILKAIIENSENDDDVVSRIYENQRNRVLYQAIDGLSEKHRQIILLDLAGDPEPEKTIGIPVSTSRTRRFYAIQNLREKLSESDFHFEF